MTPEMMTSIQLAEQCARDAFEMLTDWLLDNVPDEVNWEDYAPDVDAARDQAYKAAETLALACKAQGLPTISSKAPAP
jgi:nitroreductase